MTAERFGQSHRKLTSTTQQGNLVPETNAPAKSTLRSRGGKGDVHINTDDGSERLASALLSAAGEAGKVVGREMDRKAAYEGYLLAGTAEGRKTVDAMSDTFQTKIFGPDATLRGAQERIILDETDRLKAKLDQDLLEFGHAYTEEQWKEHTTAAMQELTDKYDSQDIKDKVTMRFGQNLTALQRDYETQSYAYTQSVSRDTFMERATTQLSLAHDDIVSGNPQRVLDGHQRIAEAYRIEPGMHPDAHRSALMSVTKNELAWGRGESYTYLKESGVLDKLSFEEQQELNEAHLIYEAKNNEEFIRGMHSLERAATHIGPGGEVEASYEEVVAQAAALKAINPIAFQRSGLAGIINKLSDRDQKAMEIRGKIRTQQFNYGTGNGNWQGSGTKAEQQRAASAYYSSVGERIARDAIIAENKRAGLETPEDLEISPQQIDRAILDNMPAVTEAWVQGGAPVDYIRRLGENVYNRMVNVDLDAEGAEQVRADVEAMISLRDRDPFLFNKQMTQTMANKFSAYHRILKRNPSDPIGVIHTLREGKKYASDEVQEYVYDAKTESDNIDEITTRFKTWDGNEDILSEAGENQDLDRQLRQAAQMYYRESMARTNGADPEASMEYAIGSMHRTSTTMGGKVVIGGAALDNQKSGLTFKRYVEGLDPDVVDMRLKELALPAGLDLINDSIDIRIRPGGDGADFVMQREDGSLVMYGVHAPYDTTQAGPSKTSRRFDAITQGITDTIIGGRVTPAE